jgi:hypothetical protein
VVVRQPLELTRRGLHQTRFAEPQPHVPQPGEPLDVALTFAVALVYALAGLDDHRPPGVVGPQVRVAMQDVCDIAFAR